MAVVEKIKLLLCCFIIPPRPTPMYVVQKTLVPETIAKDSASENEGAKELQWALDVCAMAHLQVQEAMQEKESHQKQT